MVNCFNIRFNQNYCLFHTIDNNKYLYSNAKEINFDLLKEIKALGGEFESMDLEAMKSSLIKREKSQINIIYDFLEFKHKRQKIDYKTKLSNKQTTFQKLTMTNEVLEKQKAYKMKILGSSSNNECKEDEDSQNWRIGLVCKKDCFFILTEVLKSLQNIGCEWMILNSSYKIKGRKQLINSKNANNNDHHILFLIQIFSVFSINIVS